MRRSRSPLILIRSVVGMLMALMLLGTVGLAPGTAAPVREQAPSGAASVTSPFADVPTSHDFSEEISWLAQTGVSTGWSGPENTSLFRPYQPVLRDQMAAFLYRMAGSPAFEAPATSPFADVPISHGFYEEISWLAQAGISNGWTRSDGTKMFRPYQPVLRDQMAAFLYRMAGSPAFEAPAISPFADIPTSHGFYEEISWLAATGVSTGWSGPERTRLFGPYRPVLRDQMAAFLYRIDPLLPGRDAPTTEIVNSGDSAYAIRADGTVWAWGRNDFGQLGNGATTDSSVPVQVAGLSDVENLETNISATYALRTDGTVWAWGGVMTDSSVPVQMAGLSEIQSLATNTSTAYALRADGTVWAWGANSFGQLGDGTTTDSSAPVQVTGLSDVRSIAADHFTAYALRADGTVWAWGRNNFGQLGNGTTTNSSVPVQVDGLSDVEDLRPARDSAYALTTDGAVWAWGGNYAGQLGNGARADSSVPVQVTGLSDVESLETEHTSAYALTTDGRVWAWGSNAYGQLGSGTTAPLSSVPVQVSGLSAVRSIETNGFSAYAITADGTLRAWGHNVSGELGNGTTANSSLPVQVAGLSEVQSVEVHHYGSAYALTADGTLWAWGGNHYGQLGNGTRTDSSVPVRVSRLNG
ncbi:S-layer homology domain-containing protein [Kocuria sp. CPCC 205300]|uniref:RCC1 domain-containing protein n=1 Tax=Kocuria sabuli TaxID=3071448 RepID=UPI0036DF4CD3